MRERVEPGNEFGDTRGRLAAVDGGVHEVGENIPALEEEVDAHFGERHALLAQQVKEILEFVRDALNIFEVQHPRAALDRMQATEKRVDDLDVDGAEIDISFEPQQIGIDALEQLFGLVAEVLHEFGTVEKIVVGRHILQVRPPAPGC